MSISTQRLDSEPTPDDEATKAVRRFEDLGLSEPVLRAVHELGWAEPTPVQFESFGPIVLGRDLIVQSRTGTGKTGAFGVPLVDRRVSQAPVVQALILAPTRELALQSAREIRKVGAYAGVQTAAVYGGASMERQVKELSEGAQIVSGTPGRVLDHLRRRTLDPAGIKVLVLDEADEMLSMGFAKELNAIMETLPKQRQTLLFSATVDGPVQRVAERHMTNPEFVTLSGDAVGALGVTHYVYFVSGMNRAADLVRILEIEDPESAVVFCNTKAETEQVAAALKSAGFNADWLNGDLPQGDREKVMQRTRKGELRYLVATDVAARGIDISHLTHVINFSLPNHLEQYIHRTGRTGRAGRTGTALTLVSPQELGTLYYLRLQYKIFPVERSLPRAAEDRTRAELDRLAMVEGAFPHAPDDDVTVAVARRLLTHPDAERLVGGLLGRFFGDLAGNVDEKARAERKARRPAPLAEPATPRDARGPAPERKSAPTPRARREEERDARAAETEIDEAYDASAERTEGPEVVNGGAHQTTLYINVGRKDDVRSSDLRELLTKEAAVDEDDIGRVRVRDRHSFVQVTPEKADAIIAKLKAATFRGREIMAEVARVKA
jgi:ATP-dependent RNA helicase DeaD